MDVSSERAGRCLGRAWSGSGTGQVADAPLGLERCREPDLSVLGRSRGWESGLTPAASLIGCGFCLCAEVLRGGVG